jgi:hypothetical protein
MLYRIHLAMLLGQNEHILGHSSGTLEYNGQLLTVYVLTQYDGSVLVAQSTKTRNVSLIV